MSKDTVGREPLQIVKILLPKCANTHGTAPCTATQTGNAKCFNTFATCNDVANYRAQPEGGLGEADLAKGQGDTIASTELTRTADLFAAFDVKFPVTPSGTIWEQGGSADNAAYLGITSTNLVFRAGDGTTASPTNAAKITVAYSTVAGKTLTLLTEIDVSANSVTLWAFDPVTLTLTQLGTATASGSFSTWAGTDGGAIGDDGGSNIATGEDGGTFNGVITEARFYDSTAAPDMTDDYKLEVYFGRKTMARPSDSLTIFPMVKSVSTVGSKINLFGTDDTYEPLGNRASLDIEMDDGLSSDVVFDEYLADRTSDPLTLSTFWPKFLVRQKFGKLNALVTLYEGYDGEALADMEARQYVLDKIDILGRGSYRIHCRDILIKTEFNKATVPAPSVGRLFADITAGDTSLTVTGAALDEYDAAGALRMNDEAITYTSVTLNADNRLDFTGLTRGADGSEASTHEADDTVQRCRRYTLVPLETLLTELLGKDAEIPYQFLDLAGWKTEIDAYLNLYTPTELVTEPRAVKEVIGELSIQCSFYIWWDERSQLVKLQAIRGLENEPATLDGDQHFIADSVSFRELPEQRVSRVRILYLPRDRTKGIDEETNYSNWYIEINAGSESRYGAAPITRTIYSRWLPATAQVAQTASIMGIRYQDVPMEMTFKLDAKDRQIWVGDKRYIDHYMLVDRNGVKKTNDIYLITSARENIFDGTVEYTAIDATLAGFIYVWMDNSAGSYVGDGTDQFNGIWWSDDNGLYPNGDKGAVWS